jgi:hypothetical protein
MSKTFINSMTAVKARSASGMGGYYLLLTSSFSNNAGPFAATMGSVIDDGSAELSVC